MSRILVTGAAGLIGGEVCARLVAFGHEVIALVRRNPQVRGNDGALVPVAETLAGDVERPDLGLSSETVARLAGQVELVIHCAASVRFDLSEAEYAAVNVGGTANAIAFAERLGARLLHVSTAYVCGERNGPVREDDPLPARGFANGYEASKAAAERLVRASAIEWAIARPAIVLGEYHSGAIRQFDALYLAFKLMAEGLIRRLPAGADATLAFVPIDHVAGGIVALAGKWQAARGGTFHLVASEPLPIAQFAAGIGGFDGLQAPLLVDPARFDPHALSPLERRLHGRVAALYASYFQRDPRFDDRAFRSVTGIEAPPADRAWLTRLIGYCIAEGFLPSAPALAG